MNEDHERDATNQEKPFAIPSYREAVRAKLSICTFSLIN